jgi:hypothetical protein
MIMPPIRTMMPHLLRSACPETTHQQHCALTRLQPCRIVNAASFLQTPPSPSRSPFFLSPKPSGSLILTYVPPQCRWCMWKLQLGSLQLGPLPMRPRQSAS